MTKLSFFLDDLHGTYGKNKRGIPGERTLARLTIWLITSGKVAESNSRIETLENIESKVRRSHEKFRAGRQSFDV